MAAGYPNAGYERHRVFEVDELRQFVATRVWSPCIWAGGTRGAQYFRCAVWCVLDFDDTLTKAEAIARLGPYVFLVGPTKSDGLEKVAASGTRKAARDRFRVVIPFAKTIWSRDVFEYNMRLAIKQFGSDPLPYDAGRVWQPCKSVELTQLAGKGLDVIDEVPVEETQTYKHEKIKAYSRARGRMLLWPDLVKRFVNGQIRPAERNDMLYRSSCFFFENGWTVEQVRKLVYEIPEMGDHDKIESTIRSAAKRTGASYF